MDLPDYTEGKKKFVLRERGLVSMIDGTGIGYLRTVSAEEFLASVAVQAGYKSGDSVEYYVLVRKKR